MCGFIHRHRVGRKGLLSAGPADVDLESLSDGFVVRGTGYGKRSMITVWYTTRAEPRVAGAYCHCERARTTPNAESTSTTGVSYSVASTTVPW